MSSKSIVAPHFTGESGAARGAAFNSSMVLSREWPNGELPLNWESEVLVADNGACSDDETFDTCRERLAGTGDEPLTNRVMKMYGFFRATSSGNYILGDTYTQVTVVSSKQ